MTDHTPELLQFFKALADAERLQIAGLLARRRLSSKQLAEAMDVKPAALAKHMARLAARVSAHAALAVPEDKDEFDRAVMKASLTPHRLSLKS